MPRTDRDGAGPDRWLAGRYGGTVEHLVHEVEPDAADRERQGSRDRRGAGHERQHDEPCGEQQGAADGERGTGRRLHERGRGACRAARR